MPTIDENDERGDATASPVVHSSRSTSVVPRCSLRRRQARALVGNQSVFDQIEGVLTASDVVHRGRNAGSLSTFPKCSIPVSRSSSEPSWCRATCRSRWSWRTSEESSSAHPTGSGLVMAACERPDLPGPGVYQVTVRGAGRAGPQVSPITTLVLAGLPRKSWDRSREPCRRLVSSKACRRSTAASRGRRPADRAGFVEAVDEQAPDARHVVRRRVLEALQTGGREPGIDGRRSVGHDSRSRAPDGPGGRTAGSAAAGRQVQPAGEIGHPQPLLGSLGELHQHRAYSPRDIPWAPRARRRARP